MKDARQQPARYYRNPETGDYHRVGYKRWARRDWIGGRGYVYTDVVTVWNPAKGSLEEQSEAAARSAANPGERFAWVMTEDTFQQITFPTPEDLPQEAQLMGRAPARARLTARPGEERRAVFVKRTDGSLRHMRFRYVPGREAPGAGLLPVWDLDKDGPRFVPLDAVRWVLGSEAGDGTRREAA